MAHMFIFGPGYSAGALAQRLRAEGWRIAATRRTAGAGALAFEDEAGVLAALAQATHILSSVPPEGAADPVLARYGRAIAAAPARWVGYLSSTGVYGDAGGAWVDESAPTGRGRRSARAAADAAWLALRDDVRVFRLPGIYGPGRSPIDRLRAGMAHRIDAGGQVFSRIYRDDLVDGVCAGMAHGPPGAYNLADDRPAAQEAVIAHAAALAGLPVPPLVPLAEAGLPPVARGFYAEHRRIANGKAKRLLGWRPRHPDYRAGLAAIAAIAAGG